MNPRTDLSRPRTERSEDDRRWSALLAQARPVAIPADFAARMQSAIEAESAPAAEDWVVRSLVAVMAAVGVAVAGPTVLEALVDGLQPLAAIAPWVLPAAGAALVAWAVDRGWSRQHARPMAA